MESRRQGGLTKSEPAPHHSQPGPRSFHRGTPLRSHHTAETGHERNPSRPTPRADSLHVRPPSRLHLFWLARARVSIARKAKLDPEHHLT